MILKNEHLKKLIKLGKISSWKFVVALIFSLLGTISSLLVIAVLRNVIDSISKVQVKIPLLIFLIIFIVGNLFFETVSQYLFGIIGYEFVNRLRDYVWERINLLPLLFFYHNDSSELSSHITNDTNKVATLISNTIPKSINGTIAVVGSLIMLIKLNIKLTMLVIISIPLMLLVILPLNRKLKILASSIQEKTAYLMSLLSHLCVGMPIIKAFLLGGKSISSEKKASEDLYRYSKQQMLTISIIDPMISSILMITMFSVILLGGIEVRKGTMTIGSLTAYLMYLIQLTTPITNIFYLITDLNQTKGSVNQLINYLNEEVESVGGKNIECIDTLQIENLSFKYSKNKPYVLRKLNLYCRKGDHIAIIGESGSGKTTLINCLLGLFPLNNGKILINNEPIIKLSNINIRKRISYISQNNIFIPGTILENLAENSSIEKFKCIINKLGMENEIDLYKSYLDYTKQLSGGQAQRLSIARGLARDFDILILDEAFSNLDKENATKAMKTVSEYGKNKIVIDITHNIGKANGYKQIYELKNGQLFAKKIKSNQK